MIKIFLVLFFFIKQSYGFFENFKFARELKYSSYVELNKPLKGPSGTWIKIFEFKIGGLIKKEERYCFFYKGPIGNKKGKYSLTLSHNNNCQWSPDLETVKSEENIEMLLISENKNELKVKYLQDNRTKEMTTTLINHFKLIEGIILLPKGPIISSHIKKDIDSYGLCGKRNNEACIIKKSRDKNKCIDMEDYLFCNPGTTLSCKNQKVFCL